MKILVCSLLLFLSSGTIAQKVWTLQECITQGLENNLRLRSLNYAQLLAQENQEQATRDLLPDLNAGADYNISYGRSVNPNTNDIVTTNFFSNNYEVSSSLDLFNGLQKQNLIKAMKLTYQASKEEKKQEEFLLSFHLTSLYYKAAHLKELKRIAEQQYDVAQKTYQVVEKQVEQGIKAKAELYEAQSILATDQLFLAEQVKQLTMAKLALVQAMNLEGRLEIEVAPISTTNATLIVQEENADSIFQQSKIMLPILQAEQFKVEATYRQIAAAKGAMLPSLSAFVVYRTGYFETNTNQESGKILAFEDQVRDNASTYVGLSLSIPISDRGARRSRLRKQRIGLEQAINNQKVKEQEVYRNIEQLVVEHQLLITSCNLSKSKEAAMEKAFEIAQKRYEKGLIAGFELMEAKNRYAKAQREYIANQLQLKLNQSTLNFYKGFVSI